MLLSDQSAISRATIWGMSKHEENAALAPASASTRAGQPASRSVVPIQDVTPGGPLNTLGAKDGR